ncbi:uncharacterized protein LOC111320340, partial [Stylophora pistillata]|uniref:uncharacterized protein LOC111320340 n=1 Tax=Stylophora pistillata TaxID=50429 RepID=UPI000C04F44C
METFYYVVKAGSFTKAEQVLNKSQSALSRTVMILEDQLGHKLLRRKIKGLELTRKGEEVFKISQRILMEIEAMKTSLSESKSMKGKIRISTTHAVGNYILTDPLTEFSEQYPDIDLELVCNDKNIDIFQNEVDIAIRPYMEDNDRIIQEPLITLSASLYASRSYLKKFGTPQ